MCLKRPNFLACPPKSISASMCPSSVACCRHFFRVATLRDTALGGICLFRACKTAKRNEMAGYPWGMCRAGRPARCDRAPAAGAGAKRRGHWYKVGGGGYTTLPGGKRGSRRKNRDAGAMLVCAGTTAVGRRGGRQAVVSSAAVCGAAEGRPRQGWTMQGRCRLRARHGDLCCCCCCLLRCCHRSGSPPARREPLAAYGGAANDRGGHVALKLCGVGLHHLRRLLVQRVVGVGRLQRDTQLMGGGRPNPKP